MTWGQIKAIVDEACKEHAGDNTIINTVDLFELGPEDVITITPAMDDEGDDIMGVFDILVQ